MFIKKINSIKNSGYKKMSEQFEISPPIKVAKYLVKNYKKHFFNCLLGHNGVVCFLTVSQRITLYMLHTTGIIKVC